MKPSFKTKVQWSIKRRGLVGTARLALLKPPRRIGSWLWDWVHGVETTRIVEVEEAPIASENVRYAIRYQATPTAAFRKIIRSLAIPYQEFNFIDFGSGKGRTLLLASQFPFQSVIGVEFSPELHKTAGSNIRSFRGRKHARSVESVCMDAAQYVPPPGKCVLYFNFPFHEPVMKAVMANIHTALSASCPEVVIVNYEPNPIIAGLLDRDPAFRITAQTREHAIYRSVPGGLERARSAGRTARESSPS